MITYKNSEIVLEGQELLCKYLGTILKDQWTGNRITIINITIDLTFIYCNDDTFGTVSNTY